MIPQPGQHVKCILRNNTIVEGIVDNWRGDIHSGLTQLRSLDGDSILIIPNLDDVMLIKIMLEKPKSLTAEIKEKIEKKSQLNKEFIEVYEQPSNDDLRTKKLAELKILLVAQEKKIIADKMKDHHLSGVKAVQYGQPGFLTKPRAK